MNNHAVKLAEENKNSLLGQIDYVNQVLAAGGLEKWEDKEYNDVLVDLHEKLGNASIRLNNCIELACT